MRIIILAFTVVTLLGACKKDHSSEPAQNQTPEIITSAELHWSSAEQVITSGQDIKLSFNNTPVSLRDAQQKLHAVWQDGLFIKYGRLISGTWNIVSLAKINSSAQVSKPTIGVNETGILYIAWTESTSPTSRSIVISRSSDGGTSWATPYSVKTGNLETPLSMYIFNRTVSTGITLAWHDLSAQKCFSSTWNGNTWSASDWTTPQSLNSTTSVSHDATVNGLGTTLYLAWEDDRSGQNEIYMKKSSDGGITWGTEFPLNSGSSNFKGQDPCIAVATDGRLHVSYHNLNKIYYSNSINAGASFSTPAMVGDGLFSHLAINNRNMVAISWEHFTGSMTDNSGKNIGMAISYNNMQSYAAPAPFPSSSTVFYSIQTVASISAQFIDVFWIDVSEVNNSKLKYRYAEIM